MSDPFFRDQSVTLHLGDCREVLAQLEPHSVDAVVCDPPYELGFMGKSWDASGVAFDPATWALCLRALRPGGHLLAFGGTRTVHRIACAIEDAGFEIRDQVAWMYGSGFPKSLDVAKSIDKAARGVPQGGADPTSANHGKFKSRTTEGKRDDEDRGRGYGAGPGQFMAETGTTGDDRELVREAQPWEGWGTALKPAYEPIIVARKPLLGTVAANVLAHGTGGLNIDGCRIEATGRPLLQSGSTDSPGKNTYGHDGPGGGSSRLGVTDLGRWPANVILDEEAGALLDAQTGVLTSGNGPLNRSADKFHSTYGEFAGGDEPAESLYGDSGGASRFFYCAKTSRSERNAGLDDDRTAQARDRFSSITKNDHPTVKPVALMRYLARLVTPPGGLVCDPFLGSGTTGIAAALEGFRFLGIEREKPYMQIAAARIAYWRQHGEAALDYAKRAPPPTIDADDHEQLSYI